MSNRLCVGPKRHYRCLSLYATENKVKGNINSKDLPWSVRKNKTKNEEQNNIYVYVHYVYKRGQKKKGNESLTVQVDVCALTSWIECPIGCRVERMACPWSSSPFLLASCSDPGVLSARLASWNRQCQTHLDIKVTATSYRARTNDEWFQSVRSSSLKEVDFIDHLTRHRREQNVALLVSPR